MRQRAKFLSSTKPTVFVSADIYKTALIDTLVAEVQGTPGDDRCVLLLGYQDEMETMLRDANPGLAVDFLSQRRSTSKTLQTRSWSKWSSF